MSQKIYVSNKTGRALGSL